MYGKLFGLLTILPLFVASEHCYNEVKNACSTVGAEIEHCNAKYGHFDGVLTEFQNYANLHITRNFQFMLMSSHFGNYQKNREGFQKLFKKYSDKAWEDAIDVIKFVAKRGGSMNFKYKKEIPNEVLSSQQSNAYELFELESVSKALDMWKTVAEEAHHIHGEISRRRDAFHDPQVSSYIEQKFVHEHADIIRDLAGHSNDLKRLLSESNDASLSLFLFDNYLKKSV